MGWSKETSGTILKMEKFFRKIDEIKEDIFDYGDSKDASHFNKSLKSFSNYIEREMGPN